MCQHLRTFIARSHTKRTTTIPISTTTQTPCLLACLRRFFQRNVQLCSCFGSRRLILFWLTASRSCQRVASAIKIRIGSINLELHEEPPTTTKTSHVRCMSQSSHCTILQLRCLHRQKFSLCNKTCSAGELVCAHDVVNSPTGQQNSARQRKLRLASRTRCRAS